jgi:cytochrome b6-f complex iron-sulfur subunit
MSEQFKNRIHLPEPGTEHCAPSRRGFIGKVFGAVVGLAIVEWTVSVFGYMSPRKATGKKRPTKVMLAQIPKSAPKVGNMYKFEWGADVAGVIWQGDKVRAFNITCTHLGCAVIWEPDKQEFVCPCHEGRFDKDGNVIHGVPPLPLEELSVKPVEGDPNAVIVGGE